MGSIRGGSGRDSERSAQLAADHADDADLIWWLLGLVRAKERHKENLRYLRNLRLNHQDNLEPGTKSGQ